MSAILFNDIIGFILRQLLGHYQLLRDTVSLYTQIRCQISGYRTFCPFMVLSCPFIWLPYFLSFHGLFLSFHGPFLYIHLATVLSALSWSFPVLSSCYRTFCPFMVLSCPFIWLPYFLSFHGLSLSFRGPFMYIHLATVLFVLSWSFLVLVLSCTFI